MSDVDMIVPTAEPNSYLLWCPACDEAHKISVPSWTFDGNTEHPTIRPSILVSGVQWPSDSPFYRKSHRVSPGSGTRCHSFVTSGRWSYLEDCTHDMAGQAVDGVPFRLAAQGDQLLVNDFPEMINGHPRQHQAVR